MCELKKLQCIFDGFSEFAKSCNGHIWRSELGEYLRRPSLALGRLKGPGAEGIPLQEHLRVRSLAGEVGEYLRRAGSL